MSTKSAVDIDNMEDLLQELECPVCCQYMNPPIYLCATGHSICGVCKPAVKACPLCLDSILHSRNHILEKVSQHIIFNCKYKDVGCTFLSTSNEIQKHGRDCDFNTCKCPFEKSCNCKWSGRRMDVFRHLRVHDDTFSKNGSWFSVPYQNENDECSFHSFGIKAFGKMFRLLFKIEKGACYWSMQLIGPERDASKYLFEVVISDKETQQRIAVRGNCTNLVTEDEAFNSQAVFIVLSHQTVNPLIKKKLDKDNLLDFSSWWFITFDIVSVSSIFTKF